MKSVFSLITRLSLRFRAVVLLLALLVSAAGVLATTQLKVELIPPVAFPQTIILAQAGGMTGEQVLTIITQRIENALRQIPEIVNIESTTTSGFGAVITARNNFGDNQARVVERVQAALDTVWLPSRRIAPSADESAEAFATRLLADMTPDVLIYLAERDANFLFQLSPGVWAALPVETVETLARYLAAETRDASGSALRALVEQEIIPALESIPQVANVAIGGGQSLPSDDDTQPVITGEATSRLLDLTPEVWSVIQTKLPDVSGLNQTTVETLRATPVTIPTSPPALPASWQMDRFHNATDLREMQTLTRSLSAVFNQFVTSGQIVGALRQTDDLTVDDIEQMLALDATMLNYFTGDQLVGLPDDVFAALPADYLAGLDGFTRDGLAARALAAALTGESAPPAPVDLPQAWRITPPQVITFSFDDLPLATFSISGSAPTVEVITAPTEAPVTPADTIVTLESVVIPQGPSLPFAFGLLGTFLGVELNSADDLINLQLPANLAAQFGSDSLSGAQLLSFLILLDNPSALPEGAPSLPLPGGAAGLIRQLSPEALAFIDEYDPTFFASLSPAVFDALSDAALSLPQAAPPLDNVWNTLTNQPQFANAPLTNARDVIALGDGSAAATLNMINASIPPQFAGYEVRLFNSLSPATIRYFTLQEADFLAALDVTVLLKLSPEALALVPEAVIGALPPADAARLRAIAAGEVESAAQAQAALYATNVPPADPDAPALNNDWQFIGDFIGVELNSADDFFRFFPNVPNFLNSFFDTAQGTSFAPNLFGNLPAEALDYMIARQPDLLDALRIEALQLLSPDVVEGLPTVVQERIASGGSVFVPTSTITRLDGNPSLNITVFKTREANNVETYHIVADALRAIIAEREGITFDVAFEQASFVEESINGVAREGGMGAVFAVIVILVFLSSGRWARRPRVLVGTFMIVLFSSILFLLSANTANAAGVPLTQGFEQVDVVARVWLIIGIVAGLLVIVYPGNLPSPAWRSTLVTAVSIPLSVLTALALMRWLPGTVNSLLIGGAEDSSFIAFVIRLFPESITLNIMTLSGLTVAVGRMVDDSIVVFENIFRQVQAGMDKRQAIITGARDVSQAIFTATLITVIVFIPLGLTGGLIGEFFLPFGLAVTYSLLSSFVVAITIVPVLTYLLLDPREIAEETEGRLERTYLPVLRWALASTRNKILVLAFAVASLMLGGLLLSARPQAFLPAFGEPQITVSVNLPGGTRITETNERVMELEAFVTGLSSEQIHSVATTIGGGASLQSLIFGGSSVQENAAQVSIRVNNQELLNTLTPTIRAEAERIFGEDNVRVSAASLSEQGFGGFALVLAGPQEALEALNDSVIATLNGVTGIANASSSLEQVGGSGQIFIRIDGESAVRFTAELESSDSLGVTNRAIAAVQSLPNLPPGITISEGFETRQQTEGFASLATAMLIAIGIVVFILIASFGSLVHWLTIILSIIIAPVGAAILLTLTDRVLGISAMIGLLMLIGLVVTNAVVLIDRVLANQRERGMNTYDALTEAGARRLRPILMTALATIFALVPLAIGLSEGAIIASELGTVVIGGLFSSTLLTLIVVPVAYSLLEGSGKKRAAQVAAKNAVPVARESGH